VYYSIGLVGTYHLHVGLRQQQSMPLPGSPFKLQVVAGPAHASGTGIPAGITLPLRGSVGHEDSQGCCMVLPVCDRMGNRCTEGGAKVVCSCASPHVQSSCDDIGDGSYKLGWRSEVSGTFSVHVSISDEQIRGSPFKIKFVSELPVLAKTKASGTGLEKTTAGELAKIRLEMFDQFSNVALVDESSTTFGLTLVPRQLDRDEKARAWREDASYPHTAAWVGDIFEMSYEPRHAGEMDLFVWCHRETVSMMERTASTETTTCTAARQALPGSPFHISCAAGTAHVAGSQIDGFFSELLSSVEVNKKAVGGAQTVETPVTDGLLQAGDAIVLRPSICDAFGNSAAAGEGDQLAVMIVDEHGVRTALDPLAHVYGGLTTYEARYQPTSQGKYHVEVSLGGIAVRGSPMAFDVTPGNPDVTKSKCTLPEGPLFAAFGGTTFTYDVVIRAIDKYGNECTRGGAVISARLGGPNIPQGQDTNVPVEDCNNGTYLLHLALKGPADVKLAITVSGRKRLGGDSAEAAEFPPINLSFISRAAFLAKEERLASKAAQVTDVYKEDEPQSAAESWTADTTSREPGWAAGALAAAGKDIAKVFAKKKVADVLVGEGAKRAARCAQGSSKTD